MKSLPFSKISLSLLTASLLSASAGVAVADSAARDYEVVQIALPNGGHISALRPAERPVSLALYPHGYDAARSDRTGHRHHGADSQSRAVSQTHTASGGHVSYHAPAR